MKALALTALLAGLAGAQDIDCATLRLDPNWAISYRSVERFPDPVTKVSQDLYALTKPFTFKGCGVTVKANAQTYSVTAKSIPELVRVMGGDLGWSFDLRGLTTIGGQRSYPKMLILTVDLPGVLERQVSIGAYLLGPYLTPETVIALRVDGGKLQPLLYDGRWRGTKINPKLNTLEILIRSPKPVLWERVQLDTRTKTMTFFKKYPFPAR